MFGIVKKNPQIQIWDGPKRCYWIGTLFYLGMNEISYLALCKMRLIYVCVDIVRISRGDNVYFILKANSKCNQSFNLLCINRHISECIRVKT